MIFYTFVRRSWNTVFCFASSQALSCKGQFSRRPIWHFWNQKVQKKILRNHLLFVQVQLLRQQPLHRRLGPGRVRYEKVVSPAEA